MNSQTDTTPEELYKEKTASGALSPDAEQAKVVEALEVLYQALAPSSSQGRGVFIAAAFLTPPDVISQILLAIPLLELYEVSIALTQKLPKAQRTYGEMYCLFAPKDLASLFLEHLNHQLLLPGCPSHAPPPML